MADQKLVAIHHVSFLVEQLSYLTEQTSNCKTKCVLWYILTTFPHKRGFLHFVPTFSKRSIKN